MRARIIRAQRLHGTASPPGDKSISHRALMFAGLAEGVTRIGNLSTGADVQSTGRCMQQLGAMVRREGDEVIVEGVGAKGLRDPDGVLDCGNSGTTMRLLSGIVAGARLNAVMDGDASLRKRPMRRVLGPLREMGASAQGEGAAGDERAPLRFTRGEPLRPLSYDMPTASAQVKSCVLLAGVFANGETQVREPHPSRDHTESMLPIFGVPVQRDPISLKGPASLKAPARLDVPSDFSSAAFLMAAAALVPDADVTIENVNLNPRRTGFLRALERMGADIEVTQAAPRAGEPCGAIRVRGGRKLKAIDIHEADIPDQVDEIPMLAILATQAEGRTVISGAGELRVKESDRLAMVAKGLTAMGAKVEELKDGLIIEGPVQLRGASIETAHDHRIAMGFAIAGLCAEGETIINEAEWADISYPGFFKLLNDLSGGSVSTEA
ncbi:MAG: 3-phosphoshikimate 1-carboxyvinyltransferase [Hyphomonadaceae bacterium]|nr:3-phosphoshikimate 1-carboxyvinyltransferase [Hyphomonadaceae bacterium]